MSKIRNLFLVIGCLTLQLSVWAQGNSTVSPYSRYGYGILAEQSSSMGRAMGGIGYGLRSSTQINTMNPASYSAVDSLTFLFDMGVNFQSSWMKETDLSSGLINKQQDYSGSITNINLLFPLGKGLAFSAGFIPLSSVGYSYGAVVDNGTTSYSGNGGFQQVYGGIGYKYRNFSVGANVGYLFGDISHFTYATPGSGYNSFRDSIIVRAHDFTYTLGVQQKMQVDKDRYVVFGAAYTPKVKLSGRGTESQWIGTDLIKDTLTAFNAFEIAQKVGVGASYIIGNKWTFGADVQWENWVNAKINNRTDSLNNSLRYAGGVEYVPKARSRNFFSRTKYRFGGYYTNSYITTGAGSSYDEFGVSLGMGLPVFGKSLLHISFDYVNLSPSIKNTLSENYFRITLNYTFNETWFRKWRIQ